jgi:hypothetical protein
MNEHDQRIEDEEVQRHVQPRLPLRDVLDRASRSRPRTGEGGQIAATEPQTIDALSKLAAAADPKVMTGTGLLEVADSAMRTVMEAVEAAESRVKNLRGQAELCVKHLRAWSTEFANQHAQLLEQCTTLESTIHGAVDAIKQIGGKPIAPVEKDDQ